MDASRLLIVPIVLPLAGAVAALALRPRQGAWTALGVSLVTLAAAGAILAGALQGPLVYRLGGWPAPGGIALVADLLGASLAAAAALLASAAAWHTLAAREPARERRLYHPLFLTLLGALGGVFLTGDLFNLYVFMELAVLASFALVATAAGRTSAEVTFKYAVLAAVGSGALLAGVALVYAGTGTLNMADVARRAAEGAGGPFWSLTAALLLFSFLLKGAVFPFHFWQPDAHSAAPAPVSAMLSGVLVKIGFYGVARLATLLFPESPALLPLGPLAAASALFGGLAALAASDLKRILAYSTIANMGLILLGVAWGGPAGYAAALVTALTHALVKGGLFLTAGYVIARAGSRALERLGGLAALTPAGTAAFGLGALALAGLPPSSGFLSKLALFEAGAAAGDPALLAAAVGAGALSLAYGARAFVRVFWGTPPAAARECWERCRPERGAPAAGLALALAALALGVWPVPLLALASAVGAELSEPVGYLEAVLGGSP